ncbi:MAG: DUF2786 domain-containing protein [Planctomycetes bacterium]|nr:DUF2786 domain-containing protein [Planctomycetota bacterium]MCW8137671.1 DUF2786 domain-containing protein [Planctomycetota bacterium]
MNEPHPADPCPELPPSDARWEEHLDADRRAMASVQLTTELLNKLLHRLAATWVDLNYRHLRSVLRAPSIQLHEAERRWGAWHPGRRLITISRRQVLCYTWGSVVETLKHEMAHQLVSEHMHRDCEAPHGAAFQEACRRLACDPAATGDGGASLLRPGGAGRAADRDDARLLRIQKLLALADNNPDEHEARAAFARAGELMLKYNLEPGRGPAGYAHRHVGAMTGRVPHHRYVIAGILQEFFFVRCIWVEGYDVARGARGHVLEVMGTPENVDMAEYVHDCLLRQCEALWQAFKRARGLKDRAAKREYMDGLLTGFRRQLQLTTATSAERGLVWLGDAGLKRFARQRHPRTTTSRLDGVAPSAVRREGVEAGERMRLHRPVSDRAGGAGDRGRFLTG